MKRYFFIFFSLTSIIGCSENDPIAEEPNVQEPIPVNQAPASFEVSLDDVSHDSASLSWSQANDPEDDSVTYSIYLNESLIVEKVEELRYQFVDLEELSNYQGKIVAKDINNNVTTVAFSFETKKYYLKFLKKYDYGLVNYAGIEHAHGSVYAMVRTDDQNYFVAGSSLMPDGSGSRFYVVKIDYEGNEIWKKFYDYQVFESWYFDMIESNTGFVLVGHHHVLSLDYDGNIIWHKKIDSYDIPDGSAEIKSVVQDKEGNIFLAGGRGASDVNIAQQAVLTKLNSSGDIIWEKVYEPSQRNFFDDIIITQKNDLIIFGSFDTTGNDKIDFWVLKADLEGNIIWQYTYRNGGYHFPMKIMERSNGNLVFAGYNLGPYDSSSGNLIEIDSDGNEQWNVLSNLSITSLAETNDGGLITTGYTSSSKFYKMGIFKFSSSGIAQWNKIHEEYEVHIYGRSVLVEKDGGLRVVGDSRKRYYNGEEKPQLLMFKTDPEGNFE